MARQHCTMGCSASVDQTRVRSIVSEEEGAGHEPNAGATGWNWGGTGTDSQNSLSLPNSIANSKEEEEEGAVKWWVDEVAATDMGTLLPSGEGAGGYVRAHGCRLAGKMTGGGLRSVAWASVITLDSTSVITLLSAIPTSQLRV